MVAGQGRGWAETGEMGEGEVSDDLGFSPLQRNADDQIGLGFSLAPITALSCLRTQEGFFPSALENQESLLEAPFLESLFMRRLVNSMVLLSIFQSSLSLGST